MNRYDVVIIGAGHAGCEAAAAAARLNAKTLLVTKNLDNIGVMSCNPSIGGVAKGIIVREIDALGGIMAKAIDQSGTHFKVLNKSKGPAVFGPRAQADRRLYQSAVKKLLTSHKNLDLLDASATDIIYENNQIKAIEINNEELIECKSAVITTGTFLNGLIHIGKNQIPAGRKGEGPAVKLAEAIKKLGFKTARLKTGTPPRIDGNTIDYSNLAKQEPDSPPVPFSFTNKEITVPQIDCYITHTNIKTHQIIQDNLNESAMYSGQIESKGPRYCPSIEDKIVKFSHKESHQIFLEKEGLDDITIYPNGVSTSLSENIQKRFINSIKGLEQAVITQFGYAIEYDYVDPRELTNILETKKVKQLFFAGQINGTTGYEEAAGQGIIAGINAALKALNKDQIFSLARSEAYIGVMIDDLINLGTEEPYRMFTSRAEYRLQLRADNADFRLTPKAIKYGLINQQYQKLFEAKHQEFNQALIQFKSVNLTPNEAAKHNIKITKDGRRRSGFELIKYADLAKIIKIWPKLSNYSEEILNQISILSKYNDYIELQNKDIEIIAKDEALFIPTEFSYKDLGALSNEEIEKLSSIRPANLGQASRISGITPAAIMAILIEIKKQKQQVS